MYKESTNKELLEFAKIGHLGSKYLLIIRKTFMPEEIPELDHKTIEKWTLELFNNKDIKTLPYVLFCNLFWAQNEGLISKDFLNIKLNIANHDAAKDLFKIDSKPVDRPEIIIGNTIISSNAVTKRSLFKLKDILSDMLCDILKSKEGPSIHIEKRVQLTPNEYLSIKRIKKNIIRTTYRQGHNKNEVNYFFICDKYDGPNPRTESLIKTIFSIKECIDWDFISDNSVMGSDIVVAFNDKDLK